MCPAGGGTIALDSLARRLDSGLVLRAEPGLVRRQALAQPTSPSGLFAELARFSSPSTGLQPPARVDQLLKRFGSSVWVYAAVYQRAVDQACLPLKVLREAGEHREPVEPTHPLKVLLEGVNPVMTWFDLVVLNSINLDLTGNDFWLFFGGPDGRPREIWPLSPKWVTVVPDPERFVAGYLVRPAGGEAFRFLPLGPDTGGTGIVHFKRPDPDNYHYGMGALRPAWGASLTDEAATEYRHAFYKNSARPDGILTSDQPMGPTAIQQIREQWQEIFQGPSRAYRVAVMSGNLKWQSITVPPIDVGLVKDRELSREDLIVAFQVSLAVLGIETGDVGRREEQIRFYYERSVKPAVIQRLGTLGERLLPLYGEALHLEADWSGVRVLQEDEERKARVEQALLASGATVNEIRARRGLPKSTAPLADVPLVSGNLVPIDQVGFQAAGGLLGLSAAPPVAKLFRQGTPAGEAERAALWEALDAKALAHERPFHAGVMRAFRATRERMGTLLREGVVPETAVTEAMTTLKGLLRRHAEVQLPTILETGWDRAVDLVLARQRRGKGVLDIAFSLAIPFLAEYLRLRPVRYGDLIAATLSGEFRELLGELASQGASIDQMAQAIADRFDAISEARARLIARTEVIAASNLGTLTAYQESGEVAAQEWLTARDERVRPTHQAADGQRAALGETFTVGGARLRFPGDPQGPPGETINCRCLLDGQTPIYTVTGWRAINTLKTGDLVLTHQGRFRRIVDRFTTPGYDGVALRVVVDAGWGSSFGGAHETFLTMTPEHPVLLSDGAWRAAATVVVGDAVMFAAKQCRTCRRLFPISPGDGPWCSKRCWSREVVPQQWADRDHRRTVAAKNRVSMLSQYATGQRSRGAVRIARCARPNTRDTMIERMLAAAFDRLGIAYQRHVELGEYEPDFLVNDQIVVEADGVYWHGLEKNRQRDERRDAELRSLGYEVLRFTERAIRENADACAQAVSRFVKNHEGAFGVVPVPVIRIDRWVLRKPRTRWNLEVEEDQSFVAKGLAVHNCVALPVLTGEE